MPSENALKIAVVRGIITEAQANSIRLIDADETGGGYSTPQAMADPYQMDRTVDDEGFRFSTGFSDVFIALGIGMLLYGIFQTGLINSIGGWLAIAAICWALSEIVATWQRRSLPSIVCALAYLNAVISAASTWISGKNPNELAEKIDILFLTQDRIIWLLPLIMLAASLVYYFRFRLPFSVFLCAVCFAATFIGSLYVATNIAYIASILIPSLLFSGLIIFVAAIYFDLKDQKRVTRIADNAFWLHLVASPLIVHSIMWQSVIWLTGTNGLSIPAITAAAQPLSIVVLAIFLVLMIIALVINRRAMLVSSLVYVTLALGYLGSTAGGLASTASFVPIILGAGIVSIGIGWQTLRKFIFAVLPLKRIEPYLSPVR